MPEEQNLQTNQTVTGQQNAEGQAEVQQTNQQGGPSDEWKMKRLEQERNEMAEKLRRLEEERQASETANLTDEEKFTKEQENFYREKSATSILEAIGSEISKLPKPLQDKIKADPFNPAWLDEKTLDFELYGVNKNDPKAKYEAVKKAALKSIPEFVAGFQGEPKKQEEAGNFGTNPPIDQTSSNQGSTQKDLWQMSDEELINLKKAREGLTI